MYQTKKTYIKEDMKMSELIFENPSLLLLMEHFEMNIIVHDKTVKEVCKENNISENLFIGFANLYNGFFNIDIANFSKDDIVLIINYLKNCHNHYKYEKFTIIKQYIKELFQINNTKETLLIEKFFNEYYDEVIEHLDYEEQIAFPYIEHLVEDNKEEVQYNFSVEQYRNHHSDIEYKLKDLLKLLLMHITVNEDKILRRKLLFSLFELDNDLAIHSLIEEIILMPLIHKIERHILVK